MEQEDYTKEGINWKHIEFIDNQGILDMVGMKAMNVMSLIDEESRFPKGTDLTMLTKLHSQHATKTIYLKPKSDHIPSFGIQHFAGTVFYNVPGFLEKNRDSFSTDLKELVTQTSNKFLLELFTSDNSLDTGKKSVTLSTQFRASLEALMKTLSACHPFFVRCIKPNEVKKPNVSISLFDAIKYNLIYFIFSTDIRQTTVCTSVTLLGYDGNSENSSCWLSRSAFI